jgi:23S rRNA (guanosine2251-2'-O)-methyltransferase
MAKRVVIGLHSCWEVIKVRKHTIKECLLKKDWQKSNELKKIADKVKQANATVKTVTLKDLDRFGHGHQGIALVTDKGPELDFEQVNKKARATLLALDGLEDPQNLGAILRTAWLLGVDGIVLSENKTVSLTPTVMKIASGGAEHVPVEVFRNLVSPLEQLREMGFWVVGMEAGADKGLWQLEIPEKIVWVLGSEAKGIRAQTRAVIDEFIHIPQTDASASLNVSASATIVMAESARLVSSL